MSLTKLTQKAVVTIQPSETILSAAQRMRDHTVGALVITDASGTTPLGIITDRDIVWMIAEGLDPREAEVGQLVQAPLRTASVTESVSEVTQKMRKFGVRRLPIVDQEARLIGVVSLDDILVLVGKELSDVAETISSGVAHERHIGEALRKESR